MDKESRKIFDKYKLSGRNDLIPLLQELQEKEGYISEELIREIGRLMDISTTKIYGVASFYDGFRFAARGRIHIKVCNGTSCFINREIDIAEIIQDELKILPGGSTADGKVSLELVDCMGACHMGPLISVNNEFYTLRSEKQLRALIKKLKSDG